MDYFTAYEIGLAFFFIGSFIIIFNLIEKAWNWTQGVEDDEANL